MAVTKVVSYIGCEVRASDCFRVEKHPVPNCACWEALGDELKKGLRASSKQIFCPACQTPVDKDVTKKVLKFHAQGKLEAEQNPEAHWPRVLATATDKPEGTVRGYRVFPVFEKGVIRRDVVCFGLPVWQVAGAYNGDHPSDPASAKFDEVQAWLSKLGILHKASLKLRLYLAQEPEPTAAAPAPAVKAS